jgi:hypothetical protein
VFITAATQSHDRVVDWTAPIRLIVPKIRSAHRELNVLDDIAGLSFYLHGRTRGTNQRSDRDEVYEFVIPVRNTQSHGPLT